MPAKNLQRVTESGTYFHVYNKGIENRTIFANEADYQVFLGFLEDYLSAPKALESKKKDFTVNGRVFRGVPHQPKNYFNKVELIAYSLKLDHFHLLLHQKTQKSLQAFIRSLCTRYSMYFNKKYKRTGKLCEGVFKSIHANSDNYLKYLYSYIHLNPAKLIDKNWRENKNRNITNLLKYVFSYPYSSLKEYMNLKFKILNPTPFPAYFKKPSDHKRELFEWLSFE